MWRFAHWLLVHGPLKETSMNAKQRLSIVAAAAALFIGLGGCAGMSQQDKGTAVGAGAGAIGGAVLTGGSAIGTVGGAVVGGVIGNQVSKPKKDQ